MDLVAQPPLRAHPVAVAHQEHADHHLGVDRGPPRQAVERRQLGPEPRQVQHLVDAPKQVSCWDMPLKAELVEELRRLDLTSHHDPALPHPSPDRIIPHEKQAQGF